MSTGVHGAGDDEDDRVVDNLHHDDRHRVRGQRDLQRLGEPDTCAQHPAHRQRVAEHERQHDREHDRERDAETVVIVMTAFASTETAVEAMKAGARDYLRDPLLPARRSLCEGGYE